MELLGPRAAEFIEGIFDRLEMMVSDKDMDGEPLEKPLTVWEKLAVMREARAAAKEVFDRGGVPVVARAELAVAVKHFHELDEEALLARLEEKLKALPESQRAPIAAKYLNAKPAP